MVVSRPNSFKMLVPCLVATVSWMVISAQGLVDDSGRFTLYNEISDVIKSQPTYMIVASKVVRPGQVYKVMATIFQTSLPVNVRASVQREGVEVASASQDCTADVPETLLLKIPPTSVDGVYKIKIEGNVNGMLGGAAFSNESLLQFHQQSMTIFVQTDRPIYMQGQTVHFRAVPITTDLKAFPDTVDVFMLNPNRSIVRRWLSRQTNFGAVTLDYPLSQQPVYGNWTIQVVAQGQVEESSFLVEEYYQTQFEVNVTIPAFVVDTDEYIVGSVMANYTSGVPVPGNLTIIASVEPLEPHYQVVGSSASVPQYIDNFLGYMDFKISLRKLEAFVPKLDRSKVRITASVGERYLDIIESGFAETLIFSSYLKLNFLGSSPQIFKPLMPFTVYLAASNHDGTPLLERQLQSHQLSVIPTIHMRGGGSRKLRKREETYTKTFDGVWEIPLELELELKERDLYDIEYMVLNAHYTDETHAEARAQLKVYASYSRSKSQMQITTSTKEPKVGEYIIFHVRTNYFAEGFSYIILSKGIILLTGQEEMQSKIKTFAVALSPEMSPTATVVVYNIGRDGEVVADSLTFPVDGISRNNFEVELNNRKDKTGDTIEVVIRGKPGSYVGLASVDKILYDMQSGNELSHAAVLEKMNSFDIGVNGTQTYTWYSKEGKPVRVVNYPASTYGIDANRTFEFAQLLVFTDANVTKVPDTCNITAGYAACLDGSCYLVHKRCDRYEDCVDGSDESGCTSNIDLHYSHFRMHRLNRIQRLYDNAWLWHNINIGPLGHYIFNVPVPELPVRWIVSAFGVNNDEGFGLLKIPLEFSSLKPFYMNVEMPSECKQGEEIGVRISIFNYLVVEIEVLVILENSLDYKFIHVEPFGMVKSYNPKTSFGEHQHLVFIKPGKTTVVYMPIVPTRLGNINVTVTTKTQVAKQSVTKMLHVLADGVTQYKHSSFLLDLSEGAHLFKYIDTNITEVPTVPLQYDRLYVFGSNQAAVSVVGDVVGPAFHTMPVNASVLLRKPSWCGEQNMFNFAANLYMLLYLRKTGQRQIDIEKQAFIHLNKGYQQQLSYQADDGSFFPFRWFKEPSVWLTAFCIKTLHKATFQEWENFLYIDPNVISRAVNWILDYQTPEGSFYETSLYPLDRKMNPSSTLYSNNGVKLRNVSLTAHVLIALEEVKHIQEEIRLRIADARQKAVKYLENNLHAIKDLEDPYQLAITTYALTIANCGEGSVAFNALNARRRDVAGTIYWGKEKVPPIEVAQENNRPYLKPRLPNKYDASNVETTAYALLSYVARQGIFADSIVEWLNTQRLTDGGWASTQDTILALEALISYAETSFIREVTDLKVRVEVPSTPGFNKEVVFNKENLFKMQRFEIPNAYGPAIIYARGSGIGIVQMSTQYNVERAYHQVAPPVDSFSLKVRTYLSGRNSSHIRFDSCQSWTLLEESSASGMAVLEVEVPTGYIIQQQTLDRLIKSHRVHNLREARTSERKVYLYFNYLESRPTCVSFTVQRWYPVANMTRYISARLYDYYAPERYNETIIDMYSLYVINICEVCGSYQCPYCPIFSWSPHLTYSPVVIAMCFLLALTVFLQKH